MPTKTHQKITYAVPSPWLFDSVQLHLRAWCLASRAERLYSGNLKRSVFTHWSEIVEEVRFTLLSVVAAVCKGELYERLIYRYGYSVDAGMILRTLSNSTLTAVYGTLQWNDWGEGGSNDRPVCDSRAFLGTSHALVGTFLKRV